MIVDEEEYEKDGGEMNYGKGMDGILKENVEIVMEWIGSGKGGFKGGFVDMWYGEYERRYGR